MGAVRIVAVAECRRRRGSLAALALMVGVVAAVVLGVTAGARRTTSVLDRYLAATAAPDAFIGAVSNEIAADVGVVLEMSEQLEALDGVEVVAPMVAIVSPVGTAQDFMLLTGPDARYLEVDRRVVMTGRLPAVDAPAEVALDELTAAELGLGVGDTLVAETMTPEESVLLIEDRLTGAPALDGPRLTLDVVGIVRDRASFAEGQTANPFGLLSPAAWTATDGAAKYLAAFAVRADPERFDLAAAFRTLDEWPGVVSFGGPIADEQRPVEKAFDALAAGLAVVAGIALVVGLIVVAQTIARRNAGAHQSLRGTTALGMTRRQRTWTVAWPGLVAVAAGLTFGVVGAVVLSPRFPISVARRAELDPGVHIDLTVLVGGTVVLAALLGGWTLASAWSSASAERARCGPTTTWSEQLRRGLRPPASVGVAAATRGRSAAAGAALGVAGVIAVVVFAASERAAAADPYRYGWPGDARPELYDDDHAGVIAALATDDRLRGVAELVCDTMLVAGTPADACALRVAAGSVELTVLDGRLPAADGEVALGTSTLADLDAAVGEVVRLEGGRGPFDAVVVGRVAMPMEDTADPGAGVVLAADSFERSLGSDPVSQYIVLDYPAGVDHDELAATLAADYPLDFDYYSAPEPPAIVLQIARLEPMLAGLAAFIAAVAIAGLIHFLAVSSRRRGGELATLRALGFTAAQTLATVSWQAATIAAIGVVIGAPLGVVVGRQAWVATVDGIGIVDTPSTPLTICAAIVAIALGGAAAVGAVPGWLASRRPPAEGLRAE